MDKHSKGAHLTLFSKRGPAIQEDPYGVHVHVPDLDLLELVEATEEGEKLNTVIWSDERITDLYDVDKASVSQEMENWIAVESYNSSYFVNSIEKLIRTIPIAGRSMTVVIR